MFLGSGSTFLLPAVHDVESSTSTGMQSRPAALEAHADSILCVMMAVGSVYHVHYCGGTEVKGGNERKSAQTSRPAVSRTFQTSGVRYSIHHVHPARTCNIVTTRICCASTKAPHLSSST